MKKDLFIATLLIFIGILFRTALHLGANFELVTAASLLGGYFITNKKVAFAIPLIIMASTDFYLGNTIIFLFTWSAYFAVPFIGIILKKLNDKNALIKMLSMEGAGILSVIIFFLWTNFGVVMTTTTYSKDIFGLGLSYVNAIPFLKPQLVGTLIALPVLFVAITLMQKIIIKFEVDGLKKKGNQNLVYNNI